jgi:hypothetical protein
MYKFENQGSNWVIVRPLAFKLRLIKYTDRFRRARGFIPTPSWLHGRRAIINIQNEDDHCFLKCIYRYFNRDRYRHDYRDVSMDVVNRFFENKCINISIFDNGINHETVREFEISSKIGINIFYIDQRGHEYTRMDYVSIFNDTDHDPTINLGYMNDGDKCHFVLVTKVNSLISEKYRSHKTLVCALCYNIFSCREALLNHEKEYHSEKELPIISLPSPENAFIDFDITRAKDLKKTVWYPFVCYADFEASTKVVNGKRIQVPNSYVIFSPELSCYLMKVLLEMYLLNHSIQTIQKY